MKFEISFEELMVVCVALCVALVIMAITITTIFGAEGVTP
jgi:hypothetical protein